MHFPFVTQSRVLGVMGMFGDWAFCHPSHHTVGPMGREIPNPIGVKQADLDAAIRAHLPGYMAMGEHQDHTDSGHMPGATEHSP